MTEKFNLTWHTFASHGQDLFRSLLETQEFSDVTLVSDDHHQYKVHKFILSACSTVFKNILNSNSLNTLIYLRGIKHEELESILQFIYLGEATLYNERMSEFLNVAKNLDIKEVGKNVVDDEVEELNYNTNLEQEDTEIGRNLVDDEDDELKYNINSEQADPEVIDKNHCNKNSTAKQRSRKSLVSDSNSSDSVIAGNKLYKCEKCCFQTKHNSNLHKHVRSKHNGKEYLCQQCDYQTTRSDTLQLHIDSKHMGIKYPCQQCNYIANFPSTLYCHVKAKHISV